jgi:CheY-like chemotaxis protein
LLAFVVILATLAVVMTNHLMTILHVEDDPNDVLLVQRAFKKADAPVNVQAAGDGDKAVAYLSGAGEFADREKYPNPSIVLLDLKMPRKSGFEVLEWIRQNERTRRSVVVIFTSSKHEGDLKRAYDLGANSYLVKPVGFDALLQTVRALIEYWGKLNQGATS